MLPLTNLKPLAIDGFTPKQRRFVEKRWKEWEPRVVKYVREGHYHPNYPGQALLEVKAAYREIHAKRLHAIYLANIGGAQSNWYGVVRRHGLDNPLWTDEWFWTELQEAIARRSATLASNEKVRKRREIYRKPRGG